VEALSAFLGTGNIGCLHLNTKASDSSQYRHQKRHMSQPGPEIDKDIAVRKRTVRDKVQNMPHGRRLIGGHLWRLLKVRFVRFAQLKNTAYQLISEVEAQAR